MIKPYKTMIYWTVLLALMGFLCFIMGSFAASAGATTSAEMHSTRSLTDDPSSDLSYENEIVDLVDGDDSTSSGLTIPPDWTSADLVDAAAAGGLMDTLPITFLPIALGLTVDLGWHDYTTWRHLTGELGEPQLSTLVTANYLCAWGESCYGYTLNYNAHLTGYSPVTDVDGAESESLTGCNNYGDGSSAYTNGGIVFFAGGTFDGTTPIGYSDCRTAMLASADALESSGEGYESDPLDSSTCTTFDSLWWNSHLGGGYTCFMLILPGSEISHDLVHSPPEPYTTQHVDLTTHAGTTLPSYCNSSCWTALQASLTTDSTVDTSLRAELDCLLDPAGFVCPAGAATVTAPIPSTATPTQPTFSLPEPLQGETWGNYQTRLRQLGYLGTITISDGTMTMPDGSPMSALLPGDILEVDVENPTGTTLVPIFDTGTGASINWPSSPPTVTPGQTTDIDLIKVPDGYDPTAHGNTTPLGSVSASGVCNCGSVDFTPLETLSVGTKFPFGVFNWLTSAIGTVPTTGVALQFTVALPYGAGNLPVDTASSVWETTYRPIVWPVVEFLMTLGMFWVFATKILGFGGGND